MISRSDKGKRRLTRMDDKQLSMFRVFALTRMQEACDEGDWARAKMIFYAYALHCPDEARKAYPNLPEECRKLLFEYEKFL